jgi:glycosyltransferase involved in cell wall biosynthesis
MVYDIFKKTGLTISFLTFMISILLILIYLSVNFVLAIIDWINLITSFETGTVLNVVALSLVIIFTFGIVFFILGEIIEFLFGKYSPIILEKVEYKLSEQDKEKISVIIPAYNEEKTIAKAIEKVQPFCRSVIVVNDGSEDKTKEIALEKGAIVVNHKLNRGLGQSLRDGIKKALAIDSKIIINFDADLQYRSEEIPLLVYYIIHHDYDLVMGSRLAGKIESMSSMKKIGNKMYTKLLRYLTKVGISDGQTGFRAFTDEFARMIKIRGDFTYTQEMILEAATKKAMIAEIPIHFDKRSDGKSRLMKNPFHFAKSSSIFLIKVLIDLNPLKFFALLSSIMIVIGFYLGGTEIIDWLITGVMDNPVLIMIGISIITSAIVILCISLLISSQRDKY